MQRRAFIHAFTLIELLVVIAIIGLLASIVLAALSNARASATLAGARQFSSSLDNSIGSQAVGWWDFDECSGSTVGDKSGYGNVGTLAGGPLPTWLPDTPFSRGCSLSFNGTNYATVPYSSNIDITSVVTVSAWAKSAQVPNGSSFKALVWRDAGSSYQLWWDRGDSNQTSFVAYIGSGWKFAKSSVVPNTNVWHNITGVYDGSHIYIYVDGVMTGSASATGAIAASPNPLLIQADGYSGLVDNVRIYATALTAAQVGALYASEAPRFKVADAVVR